MSEQDPLQMTSELEVEVKYDEETERERTIVEKWNQSEKERNCHKLDASFVKKVNCMRNAKRLRKEEQEEKRLMVNINVINVNTLVRKVCC